MIVAGWGGSCAEQSSGEQTGTTSGDGCQTADDCRAGVCAFDACRTVCSSDDDCGRVGVCLALRGGDGVCRLPEEQGCSRSSECPTGLVCAADDSCRVGCVDDSDCEVNGQHCDGEVCVADESLQTPMHAPSPEAGPLPVAPRPAGSDIGGSRDAGGEPVSAIADGSAGVPVGSGPVEPAPTAPVSPTIPAAMPTMPVSPTVPAVMPTAPVMPTGTSPTVPPPCGNGAIDLGEECDDANTLPGDGCNADCVIEPNYCAGPTPCTQVAICGDAVLDPGEQCDDGNNQAEDGCSSRCSLEPGYRCDGTGVCSLATCGDGVQEGFEACDDGNADVGDGCSSDCFREPVCSTSGCATTCGDGWVDDTEACDDGNLLDADGCDANCDVEHGYFCQISTPEEPGWAEWSGIDSIPRSACFGMCGDGVVVAGEQCDDGSSTGSTGCLPNCMLAN